MANISVILSRTTFKDAKSRAEEDIEKEKLKRIEDGGMIWPVWSWITGGKQPVEETSGRTFSVVSDKIKVVENPAEQLAQERLIFYFWRYNLSDKTPNFSYKNFRALMWNFEIILITLESRVIPYKISLDYQNKDRNVEKSLKSLLTGGYR